VKMFRFIGRSALAIAASAAMALAASAAPDAAPAPAAPVAPGAGPAEVSEPRAVPSVPSAPEADAAAFYASRMTIGERTLEAGRAAEAADNLRVASFGLLDEPERLSECLVWLAVAQQRAGRAADADATLKRFQGVQTLFPSYPRLAIAPAVRSEFEALARKRMPGMTLEGPREARRAPTPRPSGASAAPPAAAAPPPHRPPAAPAEPAVAAALRPAPVPVVLQKSVAPPRPLAAVSPAPLHAAAAPAVGPAKSPKAASFDRELRTGRALIFEIRPDQARLFVDGRYVGVSADWGGKAGRPFPLPAGEHAVRAVLPGYRELRLRVVADPSAPSDAVAALELSRRERRSFRRIPPPDYVTGGRVAFGPELRGAEVAVDGEPTGAADRFTVSAPMRLAGPAVHDVVLSKAGRPARTIRILASPTAANDLVVVKASL